LVNALRALLYEYGHVFPVGLVHLKRIEALVEDPSCDLSALIIAETRDLLSHIAEKTTRIDAKTKNLKTIAAQADTCHVDTASGRLITPAEAFQCLTEHFERWAACLGTHGLLVLEVHCLDIASTQRHMNEATALHFDCLQSHSGQLLVPAAHFALATAAAGLLPALLHPADSRAGQGRRRGARASAAHERLNGIAPGAFSTAATATPASYDEYWDDVSLLLKMEGAGTSFVDSSQESESPSGAPAAPRSHQ
jgi:hypothetical protein